MKLRRRYLEPSPTALYFWVQTCHRQRAIELAVAALQALPSDPDDIIESLVDMRGWTIEAIYQGAWMREYHHWETDTKAYFAAMHLRNGSAAPSWRKPVGSHVEKVRAQLGLFNATVPSSIDIIDQMRTRLNDTKHDGSYLATAQDYEVLVAAILAFWEELNTQEEVEYTSRR